MLYIENEIPYDCGYVIPIGDLHFADKAFQAESYRKLKGYVSWVKENPNARIVLGGDIFNCAGRNTKTSPFEQRMSVSDEIKEVVSILSPVKKQIAGAIQGNHECFDDQTKVLTVDGWLNFSELKEGEEVLTYNTETDEIEKEIPIKIHSYSYNGKMIGINSHSVDLSITPNHRLYYKNRKEEKWKFGNVSDLLNKQRVAFTVSSKGIEKEVAIKDEELRIMAWLLTDGCISKKGVVAFYQRESKHHLIIDILDNLGWLYTLKRRDRDIKQICGIKLKKRPEVSCEITLKSPYNRICSELLNNDKKNLPKIIYELSNRQFDIFINSFIDGDGSRHKSAPDTSLMVYGEKNILEQLQLACFLHSYRTSISIYREKNYRLNITKNRITYIDNFSKKTTSRNYIGKVWCITTKNQTVIVKRNNKISITGNSRTRNEFDIDLTEVLCSKLDIPYLGISTVINFKVKKKRSKTGGQWSQNYYGYFHHGTGGGQSMGGALNRSEKLGNIVEGCDFYCIFHTHKLSNAKAVIYRPNPYSRQVDARVVNFITCGGYLEYKESYAERGMLRPGKLGSPRIRLSGIKNDVHVSI